MVLQFLIPDVATKPVTLRLLLVINVSSPRFIVDATAETPVTAAAFTDTEPTALVEDSPVTPKLLFVSKDSVPSAVVPATPVTPTSPPALTATEVMAVVPTTPVTSTGIASPCPRTPCGTTPTCNISHIKLF